MPRAPRVVTAAVEQLILRDLRRSFRRVIWVGPHPREIVPRDRPLVLYANHHYFHDGYLLWLLVSRILDRQALIWMREWDRVPIFTPIGALPFPEDDRSRRAATARRTGEELAADPRNTLIYFPEGEMSPPDAGVQPFDDGRMHRLSRLVPEDGLWWPVAVRLTWWKDSGPIALLTGGDLREVPGDDNAAGLQTLIERLTDVRPGDPDLIPLLEGARDVNERFDLSVLRPLFKRWL